MGTIHTILDERKSIVKTVPWVQYHKKPKVCDVTFISASKAKGTRHCSKKAHWTYTYLKVTGMYKRNLCWLHLLSRGFYISSEEEKRTDKWLRKHHPYLYGEDEES